MPRPRALIPPSSLNVHLDARLRARLDAFLFSELEGKVPFGAYQRFFNLALSRILDHEELDLAPFLNAQPRAFVVRGDPQAIAALRAHLEQAKP